jgi:Helix-turn-helix domain
VTVWAGSWLHSVRMGGRNRNGTPNPLLVTDRRAMRALANVDRLRLFARLIAEGSATATQCAAWTGLDAKVCSYHLRHLSKYGFVEQAPAGNGDRRIRRWQPTAYEFVVDVKNEATQLERRAIEALTRCVVLAVAAESEEWLSEAAAEPVEWLLAAQVRRRVLRLTAQELAELQESMNGLMRPYVDRSRLEHVPGARLVDAAVVLTPRRTNSAAT